jgi:hypothetical protein
MKQSHSLTVEHYTSQKEREFPAANFGCSVEADATHGWGES